MKTKQLLCCALLYLVLNLCLMPLHSNAQEQKSKILSVEANEYYGKQAAEKFPGAMMLVENKNTSYPELVVFDKSALRPAESFLPWLKQTMKAGTEVDFRLISSEKDQQGIEHLRYHQTYKGIPIEYATYLIHVQDGKVRYCNGLASDVLPDISPLPALDEKQALQAALKHMGAKTYKWEDEFWERNIKESKKDPNASYYPKGELLWLPENMTGEAKNIQYHLCYSFKIYTAMPEGGEKVYVDANSGAVIKTLSLIYD